MKALKIIGIVILVIVVLFFVIAFFLPGQINVERSMIIPASPEVIFDQVNTLKNWETWSPWNEMDPNMKIIYEGPASGEGAAYSWTSESMGDGRLVISKSKPYEYIATDLDFMENGKAVGYYRFKTVADGTDVTWGMDADMGSGAVSKYVGLMMERMVGPTFEQGLANLKKRVANLPDTVQERE